MSRYESNRIAPIAVELHLLADKFAELATAVGRVGHVLGEANAALLAEDVHDSGPARS